MSDREFIAVFHYDNGGTNRCGAEPYRYAEEIVRCKECKYYDKFQSWSACTYWSGDPYEQASVNADDFCSYGDKRDD